jgi:hypothetical protein
MGHTITIRLTEGLAEWLSRTSRKTHLPRGRIVRDHLERACSAEKRSFLRLAGAVDGDRDLSSRKGFAPR